MNEQHFIDLLFRRVSRPWVTLLLIAANLAVFGWCVVRGGNPLRIPGELLISSGALYGASVWQGQWWRIGSALFLHGGLLHIGLNLFALWQAGALAERLYGRSIYVLVYGGGGLVGSFASLWWNPTVFSVGASGAIFGLYGALLAYLLCQKDRVPVTLMRELRSSTLAFIGFSLVAGFSMPGIDNAAHLGGLLGGAALGAAFSHPIEKPPGWRVWLRGGAGFLVLALICAGCWLAAQPAARQVRQQVAVQQRIESFYEVDQNLGRRTDSLVEALQRGSIDRERAATVLEQELLPAWQAQIDMLAAQPEGDPVRDDLLHYAEARRNGVDALARAAMTGDQHWVDRAANFHLQAENILLRMRLRQATSVGKAR